MQPDTTNWVFDAKKVFRQEKPEHFTDYKHCGECAEHDLTLGSCDVDSIGLKELGNAGWDPICFVSVQGFIYYMPALVRLTLASMEKEFYLDQFLFHLETGGKDGELKNTCNRSQKEYIERFLAYLIDQYPQQIEKHQATDNLLRVHETWSDS